MSFDNSSDTAVLVCSPCFNNLQGSRPQAASRSRTVAVAGCRSAGLAAARRSWDARAGRSHAHSRAGRARPLAKRRRAKGRGDGRGVGGLWRHDAVHPCSRGSPSQMPDGIPSFRHCSLAICAVPRCLQTRVVRCERQPENGSLFFLLWWANNRCFLLGFGPDLQHLATTQVIPLYVYIYVFVFVSKILGIPWHTGEYP